MARETQETNSTKQIEKIYNTKLKYILLLFYIEFHLYIACKRASLTTPTPRKPSCKECASGKYNPNKASIRYETDQDNLERTRSHVAYLFQTSLHPL